MLPTLTDEEKKRISRAGVETLIKQKEELLKVWSVPAHDKAELEQDIKELKELLKECEQDENTGESREV